MLDMIYLLREIIVDEFIGVHIVFSYPRVGFRSVAFPFDEVVSSPTPWFSGFSPDFVFSTVEDFLDFVLFLLRRLVLAAAVAVALGLGTRVAYRG